MSKIPIESGKTIIRRKKLQSIGTYLQSQHRLILLPLNKNWDVSEALGTICSLVLLFRSLLHCCETPESDFASFNLKLKSGLFCHIACFVNASALKITSVKVFDGQGTDVALYLSVFGVMLSQCIQYQSNSLLKY